MKLSHKLAHPKSLIGVFPIGQPVLIHSQFKEYETHIGLITKATDWLTLNEIYYGRVNAIVVDNSDQIHIINGIEHYEYRVSATYWLHLCDANIMIEDFANNWNAKEVKDRVDELMGSVYIYDKII